MFLLKVYQWRRGLSTVVEESREDLARLRCALAGDRAGIWAGAVLYWTAYPLVPTFTQGVRDERPRRWAHRVWRSHADHVDAGPSSSAARLRRGGAPEENHRPSLAGRPCQ